MSVIKTILKATDIVIHKWLKVPYTLQVSTTGAKRRPTATVLLLHGIGTSGAVWQDMVDALPDTVKVIRMDLLGFGGSPRPSWATYDAHTQARSVIATLLKLRRVTPVIVVGHSLGSLVAIEMTKRFPAIIKSLILCSPPLYVFQPEAKRLFPHADRYLQKLYESVLRKPEQFVRISAFAMKYNLIHSSYSVTAENIDTYVATLKEAIINQDAYETATTLKKPISIIRGRVDPLVVVRNLKSLALMNHYVSITSVMAAHELNGPFIAKVVAQIRQAGSQGRQAKPRKV